MQYIIALLLGLIVGYFIIGDIGETQPPWKSVYIAYAGPEAEILKTALMNECGWTPDCRIIDDTQPGAVTISFADKEHFGRVVVACLNWHSSKTTCTARDG